jgi:hypothetical protein
MPRSRYQATNNRWVSETERDNENGTKINFLRLIRDSSQLIEQNMEILRIATVVKNMGVVGSKKRLKDIIAVDSQEINEKTYRNAVKETCKRRRKLNSRIRKNPARVTNITSSTDNLVEIPNDIFIAPPAPSTPTTLTKHKILPPTQLQQQQDNHDDIRAYPQDTARFGEGDNDFSFPAPFVLMSPQNDVNIATGSAINNNNINVGKPYNSFTDNAYRPENNKINTTILHEPKKEPCEQELQQRNVTIEKNTIGTLVQEQQKYLKNEVKQEQEEFQPKKSYATTTTTVTTLPIVEVEQHASKPLFVTQSTPIRDEIMDRLKGIQRVRANGEPTDILTNCILNLPRASEDFTFLRRAMVVLPQQALPTAEIPGLEKFMATNVSSVRTRENDDADLREPENDERPCVNDNKCQGRFIPGAIPVTLKEVCSRKELETYKATGKWPEIRRTCVMCERYNVEKVYWNVRGSGEAISSNGIHTIQRWSNLVDIKDEYSAADMIMSLPYAHMGIFAPSICHKRNAYRQHTAPNGKKYFDQFGYLKPLEDGSPVFRKRSCPSVTENFQSNQSMTASVSKNFNLRFKD